MKFIYVLSSWEGYPTYIRMNVPDTKRPIYCFRKCDIATNVLGVCSQDMKFIYVLSSWEGYATYIRMNILDIERPRYYSRKYDINTNVLRVCSQAMKFIYVLSSWESSATNFRVLWDVAYKWNELNFPSSNINSVIHQSSSIKYLSEL